MAAAQSLCSQHEPRLQLGYARFMTGSLIGS